MDHPTFDRLARRLAASASRRGVVLGAFAAAAGSALVGHGPSATAAQDVTAENCIPEGKRCGSGGRRRPCKKCCTGNVIRDQNGKRRCSCVRLGDGCSNDSQCCEGVCDSGTCQLSGPTCIALQAACATGDTCCAGTCDATLDVCCIETGSTGCTVDADCCGPNTGCFNGTCQID